MSESPFETAGVLHDLAWLRDLARALVRDSSTADDLVQDALLSTLERPLPAHVPVRQSLAVRLRNRARSFYRMRRHREDREARAAVFVAQPDTEIETRERIALAQRIVELMGELREPYRSVLRLRFLDELPPREIALRTGRDVELVKLQLQRGLALLRTELDRECGGDRRVWMAAFLPWLGPPADSSPRLLQSGWALAGACVLTLFGALLWMRAGESSAAGGDSARAVGPLASIEGPDRARRVEFAAGEARSQRVAIPGSAGLDVRVLRADGEPVAAAELRCWRLARADDAESSLDDWFRDGVLEERLGERFERARSNAQGIASLPYTSGHWVVIAELGNLWGWAVVRLDGSRVPQVEVREDADAYVQVLDREQRPIDGVWTQLRGTGYCGGDGDDGDSVYLRAVTSPADGLARLRHAGFVKRTTNSPCKSGATVRVGLPGLVDSAKAPPGATLDARSWPSAPIEFRIDEPIGYCQIEFAGGTALEQSAWSFQLGCGGGPGAWRYDDNGGLESRSAHFEAWTGVWRRPVLLGRELVIEARHRSGRIRRLACPGPKIPGELVRVPFRSDEWRECVGRLLGTDGQPLRNTAFRGVLAASAEAALHAEHLRCETDGDGGFAFEFGELDSAADGSCVFSAQLVGPWDSPIAATRVSAHTNARVVQLGDVCLQEIPIVCAGVAVDRAGNPVADARVSASFRAKDDTYSVSMNARSDADGSFELRSEDHGAERVFVMAEKAGWPVAFCDADRELLSLRLVFGAPASMRGRVNFDASMRNALIYVTASRSEPAILGPHQAGDMGHRIQRVCDANGEFALDGLAPGEYQLEVDWEHGDAYPHALRRRTGIHVGGAAAPEDVPFQEFDLRASHRHVKVAVEDEEHNPIEGATVRVEWPASAELEPDLEYWSTEADGSAEVLVAAPSSLVRVAAKGFAEVAVTTHLEDVRVLLRRAVPARFLIEGGLPPLPPNCKLALVHSDDNSIHSCQVNEYFDASGSVECCDPPCGASSARFALYYVRGGTWQGSATIPSEQQLNFGGTPGRTIGLRAPSRDEIAAAAQRLREAVGTRWDE